MTDLNTCTVADLLPVDRVGEKLAERIVASQPYASWGDLDARVKGIGPSVITRLKEAGFQLPEQAEDGSKPAAAKPERRRLNKSGGTINKRQPAPEAREQQGAAFEQEMLEAVDVEDLVEMGLDPALAGAVVAEAQRMRGAGATADQIAREIARRTRAQIKQLEAQGLLAAPRRRRGLGGFFQKVLAGSVGLLGRAIQAALANEGGGGSESGAPGGAESESGGELPGGGEVNLNRCDAEAIASVSGVSMKYATAMVAERNAGGGFRDWDDVAERMRARGHRFGPARRAALEQRGFVIRTPGAPAPAAVLQDVLPTLSAATEPVAAAASAGNGGAVATTEVVQGASESDEDETAVSDLKATSGGEFVPWWETDEGRGKPFPPEFADADGEHKFEYLERVGAGYEIGGRAVTAEEAEAMRRRWEAQYPMLKPHHKETVADRTKATSDDDNIDFCWRELLRLEVNDRIPPQWRKRFRCDPFGNVVSRYADNNSLCKFDVDHVFPWSRGGHSVKENFMAVQWAANRIVKRARILPANERDDFVERMQTGLDIDTFLELLKVRDERFPKRTDKKKFDRMLEQMLEQQVGVPMNLKSVLQNSSMTPWDYLGNCVRVHNANLFGGEIAEGDI
ncbi:unnamed protein product [Pedinophyceae sp. YPF-701]|nr:unnamed protein product [Pedinophyceae sp. YPF-701]